MQVQKSAGGIVFKQKLVLLRRPTPNPEFKGNLGWSFPKGWIDAGETPEMAAVREVAEEGGVTAKIISKIKTIKTFFTDPQKQKVMKFITYFLMEWERDLPEGFGWETAETRWVSFNEAKELLAYKSEKELLIEAQGMLE